eukprot:c20687_g1_i4.p1 GENE.c20687_g1_i4~~c20687_g1_i4.p1  ORF type:complete len:162 (+),score=32.49 c20687_g1_i4:603-1088(+)
MHMSSLNSAATEQSKTFRRKAKILLCYVFVELVIIGAFRAHVSVYEGDIQSAMKDYGACLFEKFAKELIAESTGGPVPRTPHCRITVAPSYPLLMVALVMISFNGLVVFSLFSWTQDVFIIWKLLLKLVWRFFTLGDCSEVRRELSMWTSVVGPVKNYAKQ